MSGRTVRRWLRIVWVTAGVSITLWMVWNAQAHGVPSTMLESSAAVAVADEDGAIAFRPAGAPTTRPGLIFLPGGAIDPRAYVPFARAIAEAGYPAAIVRLPWRVAPTAGSRAEVWRRIQSVAARWGGARPFVLSGHSRGAALAGRFAHAHPGAVAGLALIATTHPRDEDLSSAAFPVVKILGSRDCVAPADDAHANAARLPPHTQWIVIDGANHAQFGHYGSQINDCSATIERQAQQGQARAAVVALLQAIDGSRR